MPGLNLGAGAVPQILALSLILCVATFLFTARKPVLICSNYHYLSLGKHKRKYRLKIENLIPQNLKIEPEGLKGKQDNKH